MDAGPGRHTGPKDTQWFEGDPVREKPNSVTLPLKQLMAVPRSKFVRGRFTSDYSPVPVDFTFVDVLWVHPCCHSVVLFRSSFLLVFRPHVSSSSPVFPSVGLVRSAPQDVGRSCAPTVDLTQVL